MIPPKIIEEIRSKTDIVAVVSEYVKLRKTGKNYVGLCPFHSEKTPSFTVSAEKQLYHCFGCGEGGNVFSFIMKIENINFLEAVKELGARVGVNVESFEFSKSIKTSKEKLYEVMTIAAKYFRKCLEEKGGERAVNYLKQRGISEEVSKTFNLGFAPEGWDNLFRYLISRGVAPELIEQAGLTLPRQEKSGYYDRFRNRLIFPIMDLRGRTIAFSGRSLDNSDPKYLNSPETVIYRKGETIFGLNLTKDFVKKERTAILVEGNFDLISLFQHGFRNLAAPLGTALTLSQCKLLARFAENIVLAFDSDAAGSLAAERAAELLQNEGLTVKVVNLGSAKDPDELIKISGAEIFRKALSEALPFLKFKCIFAKHNLNEIEARARALREAAKVLNQEKDPFIQKEYTKFTAHSLQVDFETVLAEIKRQKFYPKWSDRNLRQMVEKPTSKVFEAEKTIVSLALQNHEALTIIKKELKPEEFTYPETKLIAQMLYDIDLKESKDPVHFLLDNIPDESAKKLLTMISVSEITANQEIVLTDCVKVIKNEYLTKKIKALKDELQKAEQEGKKEKVAELLSNLNEISSALSR